jgi:hypothetical protein
MTGSDPNVEAYQILADLLVTIRRIIHRGLEKVSGDTWYLDGCPPGIFERLVERKERETAIDRFGGEYQELITFASLDDLAAIIEYNRDLAKLLGSLAPEGEPMIERLRAIEDLRLKLAASLPFDDEDHETLARYHREFRESLARRKRSADESTPAAPPGTEKRSADESGPAAAPGVEKSSADEGNGSAADAAAQLPAPEVAPPADPVKASEFRTQAVTFEELSAVVGRARPGNGAAPPSAADPLAPAVDEFRTATAAQQPAPEPPTTLDAERAMAADDDRQVLGVIHREVTALADAAFRQHFDAKHPVWDAVRSSGWYDLKKADLALAPLELFYGVVAKAAASQQSGADPAEVKTALNDAGFTKLLLSLREMFVRQTTWNEKLGIRN